MNLSKVWLGNFFIILALIIVGYTYWPVINLYFTTPQRVDEKQYAATYQNFIYIPKIEAAAPIIKDISPWDEEQYLIALDQGVAQASGFATPEQSGLIFLFAHSSTDPWKLTRENTAFFRLNTLIPGDGIKIYWNGKTHYYKVFSSKEVWPDQTEDLKTQVQAGDQLLILQTCVPIGTTLKRLLVLARPVEKL